MRGIGNMLYSLYAPYWDTNEDLRKLLKEVLGYNEDEISQLESEHFGRNVANNLTIEQAKEITEIFSDNDFQIYLNDGSGVEHVIFWKELGIPLKHNPPKDHYCDEPLVSREHLADLSIPKKVAPPARNINVISCPYCHSTNTERISGLNRSLWFADASAVGKQFQCNSCSAFF